MATIRKNTELRQIQIDELTKPCNVLKTFYQKASCSSYLVAVATADGREMPRFLQAYPARQKALCDHAEKALMAVFGDGKIRHYTFNETQYLLMQLPEDCLQWEKELKQPILQRVECVSLFVEYLELMEQLGYIPWGIDSRTFVKMPDGTLRSWDLQNALVIEGADPEVLKNYRRKCAVDLTEQILQALTGRRSVKKNTLSSLKLTLLGRMFPSDQEVLFQLLDTYLHQEKYTDLVPLKGKLDDVKAALEIDEWVHTSDKQGTLAVANFLHAHPLWKYARDGQVKILMVGSSPIRKIFMDTIIPCAQMLDTQMYIRIVSEDAAEFSARYLKKAQLLKQAVEITHIPERPQRKYALNEKITGKDRQGNIAPLAHLTFEEAVFPREQDILDAHCILMLNDFTEQLRNTLLSVVAERTEPLLIGLKDMVPRPEELQVLGGAVEVDSFSVGRQDDLTRSQMYRDALGVHTYYEKGGTQIKSRQEILDSFKSKYNRDSSIRAALSKDYKLAAYGLADCKDASLRFREEVLQDEARVRRLIWLEHRSWQAFMMVQGWTLDTENLEKDFSQREYNYKEFGVWHTCLFGSNDTGYAPLASWSVTDWLEKDPKKLDPLDAMSVTVHRILTNHVENKVDESIKTQIKKLAPPILPPALWQELENVVSGIQANVTNASRAWKRIKNDLEDYMQQESKYREKIEAGFENLKALTVIVEKRNDRTQYKEKDRDIMEAIPYLLEKDSIRCIYRLWTDHSRPWDNLASSFFIEPKHIYLLTTKGQTVTEKQRREFLKFLKDRRKIDTTVTLLPLQELKAIHKGAVLDVTGVDTAQLLEATKQFAKIKAQIPFIHYKDGRLQALDGDCPLLHCYRCNQSLTVEEMMQVTGTVVHNENETLPIQRLTKAEDLWNAVQNISSYNDISNFLKSFRKQWNVYSDFYCRTGDPWNPRCTAEEADKAGLVALCNKLEKARIIRPVQWASPLVIAVDPYCQRSLNRMLTAYRDANDNERKNMVLSFRSEDPGDVCMLDLQSLTIHQKLAIKDIVYKDSNGKDKNIKLIVYKDSNGKDKNIKLNDVTEALEILKNAGFIHQIKDKSMYDIYKTTEATKNGQTKEVNWVEFRFQYADIPTRDCLTKAGNILEALAYHTIRKMDLFDDVKLGVSLLWDEEVAPGTPTQNEIDLVCTKGTKSFFVSCKKTTKLEKEYVTEIRYETDRFGVNGTPILLTTAPESSSKSVYVRAQRMGVEMITLKDQGEQNSAQIIRKRIGEILEKHQ